MTGYERVRAAFEELGLLEPSWSGTQMCRCPVHDDNRASISLTEDPDTGNALIYCHAGCDTKGIMEAIGLEMYHLFSDEDVAGEDSGAEASPSFESRTVVARYVYTDEQGKPLIRVLRYEPKGFSQERWEDGVWKARLLDTRRVLYNLPNVLSAVAGGTTVYIVEGEKDVDALSAIGAVGTTNIGGAGNGKWRDEYNAVFKRASVIIIPDLDAPGRSHGAGIEEALTGVARSVTVKLPAIGKDAYDHISAGLGLDEFRTVGDEYLNEELGAIDWHEYTVEDEEWLFKPYIPAGGRVLLYGKTGSLKSLWAMWVATKLAQEGRKVAYFSLEMRPSQSVRRLKKLSPPRNNFTLFTKLRLGAEDHLRLLTKHKYDLIVIDSWNAAIQEARYDQDVADLDNEVFQPLIEATGATIMLIDNTGHDVYTNKGPVKMTRARGSSAKADKMDVTLWMDRPHMEDNYMADLKVMKMRYDFPIPASTRIGTPRDHIDFWIVSDKGHRMAPMWGGTWVGDGSNPSPATEATNPSPTPSVEEGATLQEQLALARVRDTFKVAEL